MSTMAMADLLYPSLETSSGCEYVWISYEWSMRSNSIKLNSLSMLI